MIRKKRLIWDKDKNKVKTICILKILGDWSRDTLNFGFLEKSLGIASPPHFVYNFSRKVILMLNFINWPSFLIWFPLLLQILGNVCIAIIFFSGCDVIDFQSNHTPLIKPLFYDEKFKTKIQISWKRKELLRWNKDCHNN